MIDNNINYSIIIPHYNIPDLLGRCLQSIPERDDVQVIVVDDNSPGHENYINSIPELSRRNVEFYVTMDGLGAGHARNIGLSHAKGKWIIFSDSDDFFISDFTQILDELLDDSSDIIYFNVKSCDSNDIKKIIPYGKDDLFELYERTKNENYFRICYTEPWGKIIRHQHLLDNKISFQETMAHNDLLFSVKSGVLAKSIKIVYRPLYWYVYREGSLGHYDGLEPFEKIKDRVKAWHFTQLFLDEQGIKTNFYLPTLTCFGFFRSNFVIYLKLLLYMRRSKMNYILVLKDTLRFYYYRIFYGKRLVQLLNICKGFDW